MNLRIAAAALAMSFSLADPAAAAVDIKRVVSPGGIEAWLVEERTVPLIAMEFAFRGGAAQDPEDKPGVAHLLSGLLDEGAGALDSGAYQSKLEENAVELSFSATRDSFDGSLKTLAEKQDEAFELLRLAVNEARLEAEPIERIRAQTLAKLRRDSTEPASIAYESWYRTAFGEHPYGTRAIGTEDSVKTVGRDELVDYRRRVFARANLIVVVVGAVDATTLGPALDHIFGALPASPELRPVPDIAAAHAGRNEVIELAVPQTTLVFGRAGLVRTDPDYIPAVVMNHILGGGSFTSRLFNEVREKRGMAYSVYSYLDPLEHAGVWGGGLATRNDRAGEAIEVVEQEIARFAAEGPTEEELARAKLYLTGSYALNFDSSVKIARGLRQIRLQRLPIDYIATRNDLVEAVKPEDVRRAARRVLGDGQLLVVAVGRPQGLAAATRAPASGGTAREPEATPAKAGN